jgi:hypothetical protein
MDSIVNAKGKIVFFDADDFYQKIVLDGCCFICGAERGKVKFNDEHILPNWLLKQCKLHNSSLNLPNMAERAYSRYTISCCEACNYELGKHYETPISDLLKRPWQEICRTILSDWRQTQLLFEWMVLIFFKVHLKDCGFNLELNRSKGDTKIGENYDWYEYHHLHCMLRRFYTGALAEPGTIGSILILEACEGPNFEPFDFATNAEGQAIMLRVNKLCIICVLNDAGAANMFCKDIIAKIIGYPLTPMQLREVFSHMAYVNINRQERPQYATQYMHDSETCLIKLSAPGNDVLLKEAEEKVSLGKLFTRFCCPLVEDSERKEYVLDLLKKGQYTFLFDRNGAFINSCKLNKDH